MRYIALYNSHNCVESVRAPGSSRVSLQGVSTIGMVHRVLLVLTSQSPELKGSPGVVTQTSSSHLVEHLCPPFA